MAVKKAWRNYRSHRHKNTGWIIPSLVAGGAGTALDMREATNPDGEHTGQMDRVKQKCFYTDCYGDGVWLTPDEVGTPELAQASIALAEVMWGSREVTLREIELWRIIVQPHYMTAGMKEAVLAFQAAMEAEGLTDTPAERLRAFMDGLPMEGPLPNA